VEVLLVEDSPDDADLMLEALKDSDLGLRVTLVEDGEQALEYLRRQGAYEAAPMPDLVLLDLHLPRMNGHEVLDEIRQDAALRRLPVIVLTATENENAILTAYDKYANCCVCKPADQEEFVAVVRRIEQFWLHFARRA